jgi:hypothetical protein
MEIWKISIAVLNGALFVGLAFSFVMDFNVAFATADTIFHLVDRRPPISVHDTANGLAPFQTQESFNWTLFPNILLYKLLEC